MVSMMEQLDDLVLEGIQGVVFKRDGQVLKSTARQRSKDMSHLPLPYRGDIPNDEYIRYWRKHWKDATTPLMSTRGCPFRCDFCHKSVFGDLFSARPVERSEEHTSELQSQSNLVCRLLLEKKRLRSH